MTTLDTKELRRRHPWAFHDIDTPFPTDAGNECFDAVDARLTEIFQLFPDDPADRLFVVGLHHRAGMLVIEATIVDPTLSVSTAIREPLRPIALR